MSEGHLHLLILQQMQIKADFGLTGTGDHPSRGFITRGEVGSEGHCSVVKARVHKVHSISASFLLRRTLQAYGHTGLECESPRLSLLHTSSGMSSISLWIPYFYRSCDGFLSGCDYPISTLPEHLHSTLLRCAKTT